MTKTLSRTKDKVVESSPSEVSATFNLGRRGIRTVFISVESEDPPMTRRQRIIASIPSAADLDLIAINPPAEWLADKGWK
jgi:hypothetical protein